MRIASRVIGGVLAVTLLSQLTACGSIFYPDRRGQIDGKIDPTIVGTWQFAVKIGRAHV